VRAKNQSYLPGFNPPKLNQNAGNPKKGEHGGSLSIGRRKTYRPIDPKQALHVVLRSSKAKGALSLLHPRHCNAIESFVQRTAKRWGVRVYRFANVGNHLHLLVQVPTREAWKRFSKELSGGIAQIVTGAQKGSALSRNNDQTIPESARRGFWDHLLYTRIVSFGRDFKGMCRYIIKNLFESAGVPVKRLLNEGQRLLIIQKDGSFSGLPS
jgi:REP element-mobilizing transposase RayT